MVFCVLNSDLAQDNNFKLTTIGVATNYTVQHDCIAVVLASNYGVVWTCSSGTHLGRWAVEFAEDAWLNVPKGSIITTAGNIDYGIVQNVLEIW